MSTCKDCIHAEVCPDKDNVVRPCYFFKDRSKFVELPCKFSDVIYYFDTSGTIYKTQPFQFIYGGTGLKVDAGIMFDSNLIGKQFFLTKEQAEHALKERE